MQEQVLDFISPKLSLKLHGGKMWAENNSDAKGATFAFSLPLLEKISKSLLFILRYQLTK